MLAPWRWLQRRTDLAILWPQCKRLSPNLTIAKASFAHHAFNDSAWLCLGKPEIVRRIDQLK